jgi:ubiquinone/menaquinone biosynthesis C-methylase UbiE
MVSEEKRKTAWDCGYESYGSALRSIVTYSKAYSDNKGLLSEIVISEYLRKMNIIVSLISKKLSRDSVVLEVGCGGGYYLQRIRAHYKKPMLIGIDISMKAIKERKINGAKFARIEFINGDATQLPFRDRVFYCVYSSETIEHIPCIQRLFHEAFRVMRQGALMAALTPNRTRVNPIILLILPISILARISERSRQTKSTSRELPTPYDEAFSARELDHLCVSEGFRSVSVKRLFHFPPQTCFRRGFRQSMIVYSVFQRLEPFLKIILHPYSQLLVLKCVKPEMR